MKKLSTRPLQEEDIEHIVNYWVNNSDENFERMGTDKTKLVSQTEMNKSLRRICNTPVEELKTGYRIWLVDNKPIGYNALKDIVRGDIAHMHLHMWDAEYRGKGYGALLFCMAVIDFYELFNLKMILCEPRASNLMPNKMLTKIGFEKWKTYVSQSSELSLTCELNSYIIDPKIAARFIQTHYHE